MSKHTKYRPPVVYGLSVAVALGATSLAFILTAFFIAVLVGLEGTNLAAVLSSLTLMVAVALTVGVYTTLGVWLWRLVATIRTR